MSKREIRVHREEKGNHEVLQPVWPSTWRSECPVLLELRLAGVWIQIVARAGTLSLN
jgi:hypothetical protein